MSAVKVIPNSDAYRAGWERVFRRGDGWCSCVGAGDCKCGCADLDEGKGVDSKSAPVRGMGVGFREDAG